MELRQLEVFLAVAEEASFTRAAERLHLVQSAVSAAVRTLEKDLGAALFERTTRSVALSPAGEALLPEARATLAAATSAREAVDQTKAGLRGRVRLGIMQAWSYARFPVPDVIAAFSRDHPLVALSVRHLGGSAVLADALRDGDVDVAVLSLPEDAAGLDLVELYSEAMVFTCTPGHPLAGRRRVTLAQLADEVFVDGPPTWGTRLAADRAFARAGLTRTVGFEINETATIVEFVRAGVGVGLLPPSLAQDRPGLVGVPVTGEPILFRSLLALPALRRRSAATEALAAAVVAEFGARSPSPSPSAPAAAQTRRAPARPAAR